jgi:hypothetical protein
MDERRLSDLLRAAAEDAPPAGFDQHDVVAESRRVTHRRRVVAGAAAAVLGVVVAGGIVAGVLTGARGPTGSTAAAPASAPTADQRGAEQGGAAEQAAPGLPPSASCPVDEALAADVAAVYPPAAGRPVRPVPLPCPPGTRAVQVSLPDGELRVVVGPPERVAELPAGPDSALARTPSRWLVIASAIRTPDGPGPDPATLASIANAVAARN